MTQKPMLRVEVGALGAHQVKNIRGVAGQARMCKAPVWVDVGISAPAGPLTDFLFFFLKWIQFMCFRGGGLSGVTDFSYRLLPTRRRRFLALEQEGLSVMRLMFPACRVDSIAVLIQP